MRRLVLFMMVLAVLSVVPQAGAQHWTPPEPTGRDHSLAVTSATIDGVQLSHPDEVGIFTPDGQLAGAGVLPDSGALGFAAWGDDPLTEDTTEGFVVGDTLIFRVWDCERDLELAAEVTVVSGPAVFRVDSYTTVTLAAFSDSSPERSKSNQPDRVRLCAFPNPFNPSVKLQLSGGRGVWSVLVTDLTGRTVRRIGGAEPVLSWDGCTENGIPVASGVYLLRGLGKAEGLTHRVVKVE